MNKFDGEKVLCTLVENEVAECKVNDLKKKDFPVLPENTEEYSKLAEKGLDDMVEIDELNRATLLFNMSQLYKDYNIFVYVGPILLVMNPFKPCPELNTPELKANYMELITTPYPLQLKKKLKPHTWAISAIAYREFKDSRIRQAIVISGESGAGKTESARNCMDFLTELG